LSDVANTSTDEKLTYLLEHGYPDDTHNQFEKSGKKKINSSLFILIINFILNDVL
jgi:hypothetical protein